MTMEISFQPASELLRRSKRPQELAVQALLLVEPAPALSLKLSLDSRKLCHLRPLLRLLSARLLGRRLVAFATSAIVIDIE